MARTRQDGARLTKGEARKNAAEKGGMKYNGEYEDRIHTEADRSMSWGSQNRVSRAK